MQRLEDHQLKMIKTSLKAINSNRPFEEAFSKMESKVEDRLHNSEVEYIKKAEKIITWKEIRLKMMSEIKKHKLEEVLKHKISYVKNNTNTNKLIFDKRMKRSSCSPRMGIFAVRI